MESSTKAGTCLESWREFVKSNCAALFQTALLLTADAEEAESSVAAAIDGLDLLALPDGASLAAMQESVARRAASMRTPPDGLKLLEAEAMLPTELRSVLQIDPSSRVCFVLRMFLGYATSSCARMMGIEEAGVRMLLRIAILQLHGATSRVDFVPVELLESERSAVAGR